MFLIHIKCVNQINILCFYVKHVKSELFFYAFQQFAHLLSLLCVFLKNFDDIIYEKDKTVMFGYGQ